MLKNASLGCIHLPFYTILSYGVLECCDIIIEAFGCLISPTSTIQGASGHQTRGVLRYVRQR